MVEWLRLVSESHAKAEEATPWVCQGEWPQNGSLPLPTTERLLIMLGAGTWKDSGKTLSTF